MHPKTERATNALAEFYADPIDDILSRHAAGTTRRLPARLLSRRRA